MTQKKRAMYKGAVTPEIFAPELAYPGSQGMMSAGTSWQHNYQQFLTATDTPEAQPERTPGESDPRPGGILPHEVRERLEGTQDSMMRGMERLLADRDFEVVYVGNGSREESSYEHFPRPGDIDRDVDSDDIDHMDCSQCFPPLAAICSDNANGSTPMGGDCSIS